MLNGIKCHQVSFHKQMYQPKRINMAQKSVHVTPHHGGDWQVKIAGNEKASKVCSTQKECIEYATARAKQDHAELCIHGRNGQIREKNSYGHDPRNIKG
jgi:hypothetical protein